MATFNAIAAVSKALLELIRANYPQAQLQSPNFAIYTPAQLDKPMAEGFSICLYRLALNPLGRNLPLRHDEDGTVWRPSLPLDLYFLLTPWAGDGERQQRLLGWSARFFEDLSVLPAALLNSYMPEPDTFRADEAAEIVLDTLSLTDYLTLWDKFAPHLQTSLTYVVRMVELDSTQALKQPERVQTRDFSVGVRP